MRAVAAVAVLWLGGCALPGRPLPSDPPLGEEGSLYVYLAPVAHEGQRLSFTLSSAAALRAGGEPAPLTLRLAAVAASAHLRDERLLAKGRLPAGRYRGLRVDTSAPRLAGEAGPLDLLPPGEPAEVEVPFEVRPGQATVVTLTLDPTRSLGDGFQLTPALAGEVPPRPTPALAAACTNTRTNDVTIFDTRTRAINAVVATGQTPRGLALDPVASRAWVALAGQDQLEILDLVRAESTGRIQLRGGDEPRALLLLPDRRTLLVVNFRSQSVAFVDVVAAQEVGRVQVGDGPWSIVQPPGSGRAVVVNRRASSLTVLDLASRQVVGTVATDPEPLQAQASRDGSRLYVVLAGSLNMTEYAFPAMTVSRQLRVGLGASALKVDPRTDLVYVARGGSSRIEVYDAVSPLPVDHFDLPAPATHLAIDDRQDQLLAVMPSRQAVAVIDLTSRRLLGEVEVSGDPFEVHLAGERR